MEFTELGPPGLKKVVCINTETNGNLPGGSCKLTKGKVYGAIGSIDGITHARVPIKYSGSNMIYYLRDDTGRIAYCPAANFVTIEEYRQNQLNDILE